MIRIPFMAIPWLMGIHSVGRVPLQEASMDRFSGASMDTYVRNVYYNGVSGAMKAC